MSADEETFYNTKRLHAVFALSAAAFLAATVCALWSDARRPWKQYQRTFHDRLDRASDPRRAWQPRIEQISLPDLPADNPFRQLGRVDRCTTCHLGIDRAAGQGGEEPYRAHPRLDLFVGQHSPHPMSRFGCTVCHEGQGGATDFAWAGHTPNDVEQAARWRRQYGWFRNPHWDFPMLPSRFLQSRCLACHSAATDLEPTRHFRDPPAGKLLAGYHLVRQLGCTGCHEMGGGAFLAPRKPGPSLRGIVQKVDAAYLADRIRDPTRFLPSTRMPRVYGLYEHLAGQTLAEAQRREELEIRGIVEYLISPPPGIASPHPNPLPKGEGDLGSPSAERGKRLFETQGCLACHQHADFPLATPTQGPDLGRLGAKYRPGSGVRWLADWIRNPARFRADTAMPQVILASTPDAAADIAAYLVSAAEKARPVVGWVERSEPHPNPRKDDGGTRCARPTLQFPPFRIASVESAKNELRELGRRAIARRGCFACHDIPGFDNARSIGPSLSDWGRKQASLLGFGQVGQFVAAEQGANADERFFLDALRENRREGFLWQKLRAPRSFDFQAAGTKDFDHWLTMGQFRLTEAEREAIATFVLGLVAEPPAAEYACRAEGPRGAVAEGRKVLDEYACGECHTLEMERWTVGAGRAEAVELVGAGRVDASGKLVEDEDDEGCPLHYFTLWEPAAMDGKAWPVGGADVPVPRARIIARRPSQGGALARLLYPVVLRRAREAGAVGPEAEAWGWLPPALVHEGQKVRAAWLREYLADPTAIRPAAVMRMPRYNFADGEVDKLLAYFAAQRDCTNSLAAKAKVSPSIPPRDAAASRRLARLDAAMGILTNAKTYCARCHRVGDNCPPGEDQAAWAPNLEEVGQRIQPDYLRRWLADPRSILPYTAMPVNFPPAGPPLEKGIELDTSRRQFEAVLDLLLDYDWYLRRRVSIRGIANPGGVQGGGTKPAKGSSPGIEGKH